MKMIWLFALLALFGALSADAANNSTVAPIVYYQCSITQAIYYTQPQCMNACLNMPYDCQVFNPPKKMDVMGILLGVLLVLAVMTAAIFYFFGDWIYLFLFPETDERRKFEPAVYFPKTGTFYDLAEHVRRLDGGHIKFMLTDSRRPRDRWEVSSKEYLFALESCFKYNAQPKLVNVSEELRLAKDNSMSLEAENAALREERRRHLGTDVFGLVKEISYSCKEIGDNLHSVNVMGMQRRPGGGYGGSVMGGEAMGGGNYE